MGNVIAHVLPFAIAIAISPLPVIVVVLILVSDRAHAKGLWYLIGRVLTLTVVVTVVVVVYGANSKHLVHRASPTTGASIARIVVGVLVVLLAAWLWYSRPRHGGEPQPSRLLRHVDRVTPSRAFVLGTLLAVLDISTAILAVIAAVDIGQARLSVAQTIVASAVFILIATITSTVPFALFLTGGPALARRLGAVKTWLVKHEKTVMAVLFVVVGALLISRGIRNLGA